MKFGNLVLLYIEQQYMNARMALQTIDEMKVLGESDDFIKYRSLYYEANFLYIQGAIEKSLSLLINVITHLLYYDYCIEVGKCYLLMGVIYMNKGDKMQGIDCFLSADTLAKKHFDIDISSGVYSCFGMIYAQFNDYNKAINYFERAYYISNNFCMQKKNFLLESTNLSLIYCYVNRFEKAKDFYRLSCFDYRRSKHDPYYINLIIARCLIAKNDKDNDEFERAINEIIKWLKNGVVDINGIQEIIRVVPILLENITLDLIRKLLILLEYKVELLDIIDIRIALVGVKLLFYKVIKNQANIDKTAIHFYELSLQKDYENRQMFLGAINVKIELQRVTKLQEETQKDSNFYKERAQRDDLTGLYNRSMLKDNYENLFKKAKQKQKIIGLIIFDMDSFKQYNDYFGHIAGDQCIRDVTGVMHRLCDDKIKFLRYGGDEFLGLFYDYTIAEIKSYSKLIQVEIRALNINHPNSEAHDKIVSITQGGFIGVPVEDENLYDFIRKADEALYVGKRLKEVIVIHTK